MSVADIDLDGKPDLATVDNGGQIRVLNNAGWGKWTERQDSLVQVNGKPEGSFFGRYLSLAIADLNGDRKPDIVIGNNAGGVRLLRNILPISVTGPAPRGEVEFKVYPSPSAGFFNVFASKSGILQVRTTDGTKMLEGRTINAGEILRVITGQWPAGLYLVEWKTWQNRIVRKILVCDGR